MQTNVSEETTLWSSLCWASQAARPRIWPPMPEKLQVRVASLAARADSVRTHWPPHQTGRTSSCDAPFPGSSCCRRCHNHCPRSPPCPWWETRRCPGTYPPSWPRERRLFYWNSALSWTEKRHSVGTLQTHAQRWASAYLPWLSVLCRRGFILRAGTSVWGDSFQVDLKKKKKKMEETSLTSVNESEETGSNNPTYPPFSRAGQRWAKPIIAVIQILICFPDDAFKDNSIMHQQRIDSI